MLIAAASHALPEVLSVPLFGFLVHLLMAGAGRRDDE